jgi:hypothetical protein
MKKYYYEDTFLEKKYPTLWTGYFKYNGNQIKISENYFQQSNRELDDLFTNICDINFHISLIDEYIYISLDRDSNFYSINFEKTIKNVLKEIETKFNVIIYYGEFYGTEVKHMGNQYKYSISHNEDKIILKKKILNWDTYNKKSADIENESNLIKKIKVMKIS